MFEILLLAAVALIIISQLLPDDESDEHPLWTEQPLTSIPLRQPSVHLYRSLKNRSALPEKNWQGRHKQ
jgi:hypothetical protein